MLRDFRKTAIEKKDSKNLEKFWGKGQESFILRPTMRKINCINIYIFCDQKEQT